MYLLQVTKVTPLGRLEGDSYSGSQEIHNILWNPEVHYLAHKNLLLNPVLSQMNPAHTRPSYFSKINFNIILLCLDLPSDFQVFLPKSCLHFSSVPRMLPQSHPLDMIILMVLGE
jgi:hypothetical protein